MQPTKRPCEICGNNDVDCYVVSSSCVAMSQNTCNICNVMYVESMQYGDNNTYNRDDDRYYDASDNHIVIKTKKGKEFNTRSEYVKYLDEQCS